MAAMRIAVISDIHGNCVALDAVIEDVKAHPVDRWICLGDAVQGGPQPAEVIERLRELECPVVIGNADAFVLHGVGASSEPISEGLLQVRDWTVDQLGSEGLDFLRSFVPTYELALGGDGRMLCFHGSPDSYDEVLLPETGSDELRAALGSHEADVLCGGHTHLQWTVPLDGKTFFNPGSVGVAYNRHMSPDDFYIYPNAEFAIVSVEDGKPRLEFCRVPFDVDALERAALDSGHPFAETEATRYRPRT